jgi:fructoselysine and glucoselysine-specific PTS system IIC component
MPFFFLGFLLCSYVGMPVLGVALLAIIIVIEKFNLLGGGMDAQLALEEDDDDF